MMRGVYDPQSQVQKGTFVVTASHTLDRLSVTFDDANLVANAGLVLPGTLAQHLGVEEVIGRRVDLSGRVGGANTPIKAMTVISALLALLGVCRATLRDALHTLTDLGHVTARRGPHGGTFVTYRPDVHAPVWSGHNGRQPVDLDDALAFQSVVEPGVAELAARRPPDPADRPRLQQRLHDTTAATSSTAYQFADARLHLAIAELTASPTAIAAVADVHMALAGPLATLPTSAWAQQSDVHGDLVDVVVAGQPAAARDRMHRHVAATAAFLRDAADQPRVTASAHGTRTDRRATP
ncbi:hypothetical protein BH23ACT10_BH23ACT10_12200 [soil metagenome]